MPQKEETKKQTSKNLNITKVSWNNGKKKTKGKKRKEKKKTNPTT